MNKRKPNKSVSDVGCGSKKTWPLKIEQGENTLNKNLESVLSLAKMLRRVFIFERK